MSRSSKNKLELLRKEFKKIKKKKRKSKAPSCCHQTLISTQAASWPTTSTSGCLLSAQFQADGSLESDWQEGGANVAEQWKRGSAWLLRGVATFNYSREEPSAPLFPQWYRIRAETPLMVPGSTDSRPNGNTEKKRVHAWVSAHNALCFFLEHANVAL